MELTREHNGNVRLAQKAGRLEWHQYVRTTIKVRRENRRQRIDDAKRVAAEQVGAAGAALAAGSKAAGAAARDAGKAGLDVAVQSAQGIGGFAFAWLRRPAQARRCVDQPPAEARDCDVTMTDILARPNIGGPIALAGAIALGSGIGRFRTMGADAETLVALIIGLVLFAGLADAVAADGIAAAARCRARRAATRAGRRTCHHGGRGIAWFVSRSGGADLANLGGLLGSAKPIEGRAQAVTGDVLRVGNTTIRLAGIEAPEAEQRCGRGSKQWRCGASAQAALSKLVGGRSVQCTSEGNDAGRVLARCAVGGNDVAADLVKRGHVFAESGFFSRYSSQEQEARTAKAGLWSGDAERPSEYRAKVWDEAKRTAPDGCPIKGLVRATIASTSCRTRPTTSAAASRRPRASAGSARSRTPSPRASRPPAADRRRQPLY